MFLNHQINIKYLFTPFMLLCLIKLMLFCGHDREINSTKAVSISVPKVPAVNDSTFTVTGIRSWYIISNGLDSGQDTVDLCVTVDKPVDRIDCFIGNKWFGTLDIAHDTFTIRIDISNFSCGTYDLSLSAELSDTAFACLTFHRSYPLYVVMSNDWDKPYDSANGFDQNLTRAELLHHNHPELLITHFVGPYAFTDSTISVQRKEWFVQWLTMVREIWKDEIGLHIHSYCNFVEAAGIQCRFDSLYEPPGMERPGYLIPSFLYSESEFSDLLQFSDSLFAAKEMGKPVSFRAGGWWAELHTLKALTDNGYLVDASGCNYHWVFREDTAGILYSWFQNIWPNMSDTTQPYYPSVTDISQAGNPSIPVLEVPDNGVLVDYISGDEMIGVFRKNWDGNTLDIPKQFSIGYHPVSLNEQNFSELEMILDYCDLYLASEDKGPVVYARMRDLPNVWKPEIN